MLIFTYKLEKYIKNKILPKILLLPKKYIIKGSFKRKAPYVTDVDVINVVYPGINENNIYQELVKLIERIKKESDIILIYITCGTDDRFKIINGTNKELQQIKLLFNDKDAAIFDHVLKKYENDINKKIFFANEMVWEYYRLRWTPQEVLNNKKILSGNVAVKFTDTIKDNSILLLQYFIKIGSYPIGTDVVVNYKPTDFSLSYNSAGDYQIKLANYSREYYYMLFPFRYYFKNNVDILRDLEYLIENKLGLYKQLMVRIDTYTVLYNSQNLDIRTATDIVTTIIKDTTSLPGFNNSQTIQEIRKVAMDNTPETKMREWNILLTVLYDEIDAAVNIIAKDYFFKYLEMIPESDRKKYYLTNTSQTNTEPKKNKRVKGGLY